MNTQVQSQLQALEQEKRELESKVCEMEEELSDLRDAKIEVQKMEAQLVEERKAWGHLRSSLESQRDRLAQALEDEKGRVQAMLNDSTVIAEETRDTGARLRRMQMELDQRENVLANKTAELERTRDSTTRSAQELEQRANEVKQRTAELQKKISAYNERVRTLNQSTKDFKVMREAHMQEMQKVNGSDGASSERVTELERAAEVAKQEVARLQRALEDRNAGMAALGQQVQQLEQLVAQMELEQQGENMRGSIDAEELEERRSALDETENSLRELESQLDQKKLQLQQGQQALDKGKDDLSQKIHLYNERVK